MNSKLAITRRTLFLTAAATAMAAKRPIIDRLQSAPTNAGFRMPGYFIWGGSIMFASGEYHLFASRWPNAYSVQADVAPLSGYMQTSEIVRAVADNPVGPYEFAEVVVAGRGGDYWDGQMCHNPKIVKVGDQYVLFYIGIIPGTRERKIGYAVADSMEGPWRRSDSRILLTDDANNPAPYVHEDGRTLLAFRDRNLTLHIAEADRFDGRYRILAGNLVPGVMLEDPTLFFQDGVYHMVLEDNRGGLTGDVRHGAHLFSTDGAHWKRFEPIKTYTHTVKWTDGGSTTFDRRERPELVNLDNPPERKFDGDPTHLITGVQLKSESWCLVQPINRTR